jgi:hypothetical protein
MAVAAAGGASRQGVDDDSLVRVVGQHHERLAAAAVDAGNGLVYGFAEAHARPHDTRPGEARAGNIVAPEQLRARQRLAPTVDGHGLAVDDPVPHQRSVRATFLARRTGFIR